MTTLTRTHTIGTHNIGVEAVAYTPTQSCSQAVSLYTRRCGLRDKQDTEVLVSDIARGAMHTSTSALVVTVLDNTFPNGLLGR